MGAQVSVTRSDVMNRVLQEQVQKGGAVTCQNVTGDIRLVFDQTTGRNILITQQCRTDAEQTYEGLVKELSKAIQRNSAVTEGGLGIGTSVATSRAKNMVEQIQRQECGVSNVSNVFGDIELDATGSDLQDIRFEQIGNASQNCVFGAIADAVAEIESDTEAKSKGYDPLAFLGGNLWIILIILGLGGLGVAYFRSKENKGGESFFTRHRTKIFGLLGIIVLVLLILWALGWI